MQLRGVAGAAIAQVHMISGRAEQAIGFAEQALADARSAGDSHTAARALVERAGARTGNRPRAEALLVLEEALEAARQSGDAVLLTRAINNGLDLLPAHSDDAARLRAEMQEVSSRVGFDKLGTASVLLMEFDAAFGAGDLPALRRVSAEGAQWWNRNGAERGWVTAAQVSYALEEGRLADAADALAGLLLCCEEDKRQHYLRLDIGLAAARGDRDGALELLESLVALPALHDTASALDHVVMLVEDLVTLGVPTSVIRSKVLDEWLGEHPSASTFRAHADGLLKLAEHDHAAAVTALSAVLADPDPCLARPVIGSLRTALAEALLGAGDRKAALETIRHVIDVDLGRWPGVRRDRAEALARRLEGASARADGELTAREREVAALARPRADQQPARRAAVHLAEDGRRPRVQHPRQARPVHPRRDRRLGRQPSPPERTGPTAERAQRWLTYSVREPSARGTR